MSAGSGSSAPAVRGGGQDRRSGAPGTLYVVATPIGHLGDLSPRAAEVLRTADAVVAEDTRRTRKLFAHLGANAPPLVSLPAFDERARLGPIVERLATGQRVALCTDAGTPALSDPGQALVDAAWTAGAQVVPVPGPCAGIAALSASGLPSDRFLFLGFLPRKGAGRAEALELLRRLRVTAVLYEAGPRTASTLTELRDVLGDRPALVARELTKVHEELARERLSALAARFAGEVRGEVTIVVGPAARADDERPEDERAQEAQPLEDELRRRMASGEAPSAIAREVAKARGLVRSEVYAALQRLKP